MMSPRRSVARTRSASARWDEARLREAPRSASVSLAPELGVLHEVAGVAGHRLGQLVEVGLRPAQPLGQADHSPVRLELGERRLEERGGACAPGPRREVDGHVVGRAEAGVQRVGTGAGQAGHGGRVDARLPEHYRVPFHVDAAPPRAPGQLGVLPRGERGVRLAVPFVQPLDDDGPRGHVHAEGERLGGEHRPDQPGGEQLLHDLLERGQQPGVVRRDAPAKTGDPVVVAEDAQVFVGDIGGAALGDRLDLLGLVGGGQPQAGGQALLHRGVAARTAEDERDRGQQPGGVQPVDDLRTVGRGAAPRPVPAAPRAGGRRPDRVPVREPDELGVDLVVLVVGEQVIEAPADQHVLPQRHGPVLVDDHLGPRRLPAPAPGTASRRTPRRCSPSPTAPPPAPTPAGG